MGREAWVRLGLALVLLTGGLLFGQRLLNSQSNAGEPTDSMAFRQWLWESRSLDLAVQMGLILTGALAIAALLPRPGESEDSEVKSQAHPIQAGPGRTPQDEAR